MTKLKLKIRLDTSKPVHAKALKAFLAEMSEEKDSPTPALEAPIKKRSKKKAIEPLKAEATEVENSITEEEELTPSIDITSVSIDDVRMALSEVIGSKGDTARSKAAAKLGELEAKNVSTLDEKHYAVFIDYLNSL